jgi:hypothetical protein
LLSGALPSMSAAVTNVILYIVTVLVWGHQLVRHQA